MDRPRTPRRRPEASIAPTSLHEITRRYVATALALSKAMGLPLSETFMKEHRESISCCFIEAGRAGVRLPPAVQLPPLAPVTFVTPEVETVSVSEVITELPVLDGTPEPEPDREPLPPEEGEASAISTNGDAPLPTRIPTGDGWPCSGYEIATLKPAQLHLVLARAGFRAHNDTSVMPLLAALQVEREQRLQRGRKPRREG